MTVFDEARAAGAKMAAQGQSLEGRINVYACTPHVSAAPRAAPVRPGASNEPSCGYSIVTIDRDAGVTPMFVKCGHCGGTATSRMYHVGPGLEPTHEWIRPASKSDLPNGYTLPGVSDHLRNGGLLLRPIGKGKWIKPTPQIKAFIADEQRRLAALTGRGR